MITYSQFCPVAKAAEVFGDRWTPIIMRELCFGTPAFGELLERGIPKGNRSPRYWWLVMRPEDIEVCLKPPARDVDVAIAADPMTFTKAWLGYVGLATAVEGGKISLHGSARAIATARRLLALPGQPMLKTFRFAAFPTPRPVAA
jgi:hypothetical protein